MFLLTGSVGVFVRTDSVRACEPPCRCSFTVLPSLHALGGIASTCTLRVATTESAAVRSCPPSGLPSQLHVFHEGSYPLLLDPFGGRSKMNRNLCDTPDYVLPPLESQVFSAHER